VSAEIDAGAKALEREANIFAAELLMPEEAVRTEWARAGDPAELAATFGVSDLAMRWRLYSFELVEEPPA
jgi:Zn-dependent peptidase ImmA (M78 family)